MTSSVAGAASARGGGGAERRRPWTAAALLKHVRARARDELRDAQQLSAAPTCTFDEGRERFRSTFVTRRHYDTVLGERSGVVRDEHGKVLGVLLKNVLPADYLLSSSLAEELASVARVNDSRGAAAGRYDTRAAPAHIQQPSAQARVAGNGYIMYFRSSSGATMKVANRVRSGVFGYYLPKAHLGATPRRCAYNRSDARHARVTRDWAPLLRAVATAMRAAAPRHYAAQMRTVAPAHRAQLALAHTPYTTGTVNVNFRTGAHVDANNVAASLNAMFVVEPDLERCAPRRFGGGELVFPRYRVAIDARHGDVVLMNVHEWHGNAPIRRSQAPRARVVPPNDTRAPRRVSVVLYARGDIVAHCERLETEPLAQQQQTTKRARDAHNDVEVERDGAPPAAKRRKCDESANVEKNGTL